MNSFHRVHAALFDELERQGALTSGIDIGRLTEAVHRAQAAVSAQPLRIQPPNPRCANGSCEG
jgi:hypothetical protein